MRAEQKNMFTGQYDVVYDDEPYELEVRLHELSLEPFLCPACREAMIEPEWEEYYDEDEDKVYNYYHHYCDHCQFEDLVNDGDFTVVHIGEEKDKREEQERKEYEKLYDRRLL